MATPTSGDSSTQPLTVNKSVLNLDIPLHNCGPAGLGVTVYTKSTSSMVGGEMGVYIKSIVAGGAAAMVSVGVWFLTMKSLPFLYTGWSSP